MNKLKKLPTLILFSLLPAVGLAAEGAKHSFIPADTVHEVQLTFVESYGDIFIDGTDAKEITIIADDYEQPEDEDEADGFVSVFSIGRDNTGIGLTIEENENSVKITGVPNSASSDYSIRIPHHFSLKVNIMGNGDTIIQNFKGEIEVAVAEGDAVIRNISGPATLHNMNGDLVVSFSEVFQEAPTSITNLNGDTVVSIPPDTQANLQMKSLNSDIRTNLNIAYDTDKRDPYRHNIGQRTVTGVLNGGGVLISLESINGDIVLKKAGDKSGLAPRPPKPPKPPKVKRIRPSIDDVEEVEEVEELN